MATWELQLLSRISRGNELHKVLQWGITEEDFLTNEGRSLFRAVMGYYHAPETYGSTPGVFAMNNQFPSLMLVDDVSMTTEALCVETRKQQLKVKLKTSIQQGLELVEYDPIEAATRLCYATKDIVNVGFNKSVDTHFSTAFERAVERAKLIAQGYDFSVAKWPWKPLQRATMGVQFDDYVVLYGRPKSMKSWCLSYVAASLYDQDKRILIYTKEMTPDNIFQRIGCTLARVDYDRFRHGSMTLEEWQAVNGTIRNLMYRSKQQTFVCLNGQDAPKGRDTVEWLDSKCEQYDPEIVLIDGMYLMSDSKGSKKKNERVANISNELRNFVLQRRRPVFATLQANRDAAKNTDANLDEISFSDAIGQDATLLIRVINEHRSGRPTLALIVGGARECRLEGFRIWGQPAMNFDDFTVDGQELSGREVEQARVDDSGGDDKDKKKKQQNGYTPAHTQAPTEAQAATKTTQSVNYILNGRAR